MLFTYTVRPDLFGNSSLTRAQGHHTRHRTCTRLATLTLWPEAPALIYHSCHRTPRRVGVVRVAADLVGRAWRGADRPASLSPSVSRGWPRLACDTPAAPHTHPNVAKIAKPTRIAADTFKVVEVGGEKHSWLSIYNEIRLRKLIWEAPAYHVTVSTFKVVGFSAEFRSSWPLYCLVIHYPSKSCVLYHVPVVGHWIYRAKVCLNNRLATMPV